MDKTKFLIVITVLGAVVAVWVWPLGAIRFKDFSPAEFTQQLLPLALVALFIERSLEVFLTTWRGGKAAQLEREIEKATELAKADPTKAPGVHISQDTLTDYKSATKRIALPAALVLGILISALGIRGLGTLVDPKVFNDISIIAAQQRSLFNAMDVLLTGSVIGGGSDFVHKLITTFTDLMAATSRKAKA